MMKKNKFFALTAFVLFTFGQSANASTVSFEYYQRLIFLKVKVDHSDSLLFLFDTGANASAIDSKTAERLNLKTMKMDSVYGSAGAIFVPSVKAKSVKVGGKRIKDILFTKYDLSYSLAPPGQHLDGILGTDFLKYFVVTIDFKNKLMTFSEKPEDKFTSSFSFELENGIPRVKGMINKNISTYFRYDSGSSLFETKDIYLNTTMSVFENLSAADPMLKPVAKFSASGVGGNVDLHVYKISSIFLSDLEIPSPFIIVQPRQGYFADPKAVGFFGNNLMEKFEKVSIDFPGRKIYVVNSSF